MNWKLPDGRIVRLGERVVKSTTGYDLFRFLLHTDGRYGQAVDYVLRLRPDCGSNAVYQLRGDSQSVYKAGAAVLSTCWLHWFDAVDVVYAATAAATCELRIQWHGPEAERPVCEEWLRELAVRQRLDLSYSAMTAPDGLPDFVLKTAPEALEQVASQLAPTGDWQLTALLYCGVLHGRFVGAAGAMSAEMRQAKLQSLCHEWQPIVAARGGDVQAAHLRRESSGELESNWLRIFAEELERR